MGLVFNKGANGQESSGTKLATVGSYMGTNYAPPTPVSIYSPAQQHTINSFKTLDTPTRAAMLGSFQRLANSGDKGAAAKYQLLKDHVNEDVPQAPDFVDHSITGQAYRAGQSFNKFTAGANKAVASTLIGGTASFLGGDLGPNQKNNSEVNKPANAKSLPNQSLKGAGLKDNLAVAKSTGIQSAENFGVVKGLNLAGKAVKGGLALRAVAKGAGELKAPAQIAELHGSIAKGDAQYAASGTGLPAPAPVKALPAPSGRPTIITTAKGDPMSSHVNTAAIDGGKRIARIDRQLTSFHAGTSSLAPEDAKALMLKRNQLVQGRTQTRLDNIAGQHSQQTGQPLAVAHDWVDSGKSPQSSAYAAAKQEGVQLKASAPKPPDRSAQAEQTGKHNIFAAIRDVVSPETRSPLSQELGTHLRNAMGTAENSASVEKLQNAAAEKHFGGLTDAQRTADVSNYERTGSSDLAPTKGFGAKNGESYDTFYKNSMESAHATSAKVLGDDKVGWVDNYVRHMFKFEDNANAEKGSAVLQKLAGEKGFTKNRTLDMPLDEALKAMKASGIKVESAVNNRESLRQFTVNNSRRLEAFHNAYQASVKDGLLGTVQRDGYVKVPQTVIQAIAPKVAGEVHYASPEVAAMYKNVVSTGLHGNRLFDLARDASASVTQLELSFSAYHAGMTAVTNGVSHLASVFHELSHGDLLGAGSSLVKSIPGVGITKDLLDGRALRNGLKNGDPSAVEKLAAISQAGGRVALQHDLKSAMTEKMLTGFKSGDVKGIAGATLRVPFAITQQVSRPLMEYAIPRIKDGMMLDRAASVARQYGGLDSMAAKLALAKAQNSIDNRMGEVVFANKFWNKTARDLGQLAYLSEGYRSGTVGELGGGLLDMAKLPKGQLTERTAFLGALPIYVGMIGAVYGYLHGHPPQELKDYFYPKNGQKDANGNDVRVQLPSYMRDFRNFGSNPLKEIAPNSPTMTTLSSIISNKDYFGNLVRNPNDPASVQAMQVGQYLMSQLSPISVQNSGKTGAGLGPGAETFVGITKAPAAESYSPAQKEIYKLEATQGPQTPEQQAQSKLKQVVRTQVQAGKTNTPEMQQLSKDYTPTAFKQFLKGADDPLQTLFDKLPIEQKIKFVNDLPPAQRQGISLDKFIATSVVDLGTKGKVKDPHALNTFLKGQGVTINSKDDANRSSYVINHKADLRAAYKAKPKTPKGQSDYGQ